MEFTVTIILVLTLHQQVYTLKSLLQEIVWSFINNKN